MNQTVDVKKLITPNLVESVFKPKPTKQYFISVNSQFDRVVISLIAVFGRKTKVAVI